MSIASKGAATAMAIAIGVKGVPGFFVVDSIVVGSYFSVVGINVPLAVVGGSVHGATPGGKVTNLMEAEAMFETKLR